LKFWASYNLHNRQSSLTPTSAYHPGITFQVYFFFYRFYCMLFFVYIACQYFIITSCSACCQVSFEPCHCLRSLVHCNGC
jgi:hypothetical protein